MTFTQLLEVRFPTPNEHLALAAAVGWSDAFDAETLPQSLAGSTFGVVAVSDDRVIAMGRVAED